MGKLMRALSEDKLDVCRKLEASEVRRVIGPQNSFRTSISSHTMGGARRTTPSGTSLISRTKLFSSIG